MWKVEFGSLHAETSASLGTTSRGVSVCHRNSPRLKKWSFHADFISDLDVMHKRAVGRKVEDAKAAARFE